MYLVVTSTLEYLSKKRLFYFFDNEIMEILRVERADLV